MSSSCLPVCHPSNISTDINVLTACASDLNKVVTCGTGIFPWNEIQMKISCFNYFQTPKIDCPYLFKYTSILRYSCPDAYEISIKIHSFNNVTNIFFPSDGRNHVGCCKRRGIPDMCLDFCYGVIPSNLDTQHLACLIQLPDILSCLEEGHGKQHGWSRLMDWLIG